VKLSDWPQVEALVHARLWLIGQRDHCPIDVVIGGCHQSAEFVEHVGPAIRLELRYQIEDIERRLEALGVTID
jgi:hypothetical protein